MELLPSEDSVHLAALADRGLRPLDDPDESTRGLLATGQTAERPHASRSKTQWLLAEVHIQSVLGRARGTFPGGTARDTTSQVARSSQAACTTSAYPFARQRVLGHLASAYPADNRAA